MRAAKTLRNDFYKKRISNPIDRRCALIVSKGFFKFIITVCTNCLSFSFCFLLLFPVRHFVENFKELVKDFVQKDVVFDRQIAFAVRGLYDL